MMHALANIKMEPTEAIKVAIIPMDCACRLLIVYLDAACCPSEKHVGMFLQDRGLPLVKVGAFSMPSSRKNSE